MTDGSISKTRTDDATVVVAVAGDLDLVSAPLVGSTIAGAVRAPNVDQVAVDLGGFRSSTAPASARSSLAARKRG